MLALLLMDQSAKALAMERDFLQVTVPVSALDLMVVMEHMVVTNNFILTPLVL